MYFNASRLQQRVPIKKNFLGEHTPKPPPSKLTAAPLDRQISLFMGKTQSHAWCLGVQVHMNVQVYTCRCTSLWVCKCMGVQGCTTV